MISRRGAPEVYVTAVGDCAPRLQLPGIAFEAVAEAYVVDEGLLNDLTWGQPMEIRAVGTHVLPLRLHCARGNGIPI